MNYTEKSDYCRYRLFLIAYQKQISFLKQH